MHLAGKSPGLPLFTLCLTWSSQPQLMLMCWYPRCSWAWAAPPFPALCWVASDLPAMLLPSPVGWTDQNCSFGHQREHGGTHKHGTVGMGVQQCGAFVGKTTPGGCALCSAPAPLPSPGLTPAVDTWTSAAGLHDIWTSAAGLQATCRLPTHWGSEPSTKNWGERRDRDVCHEKGN